ncbi:MAG: tetratricopeptide repeat protein, partial [Sphingobacteriales bacterium]
MRSLLVSIFILLFITVSAQGTKVSKQTQKLYQQAMSAAEEGNYRVAISLLTTLINSDKFFPDAWLSRAGLHGELRLYPKAVADYEEAFKLNPHATEYKLPYSINLAGMGQFEKALDAVNDFLALPNLNESSRKAATYRKSSYEFAIQQAKESASKNYIFEPKNLGDSI